MKQFVSFPGIFNTSKELDSQGELNNIKKTIVMVVPYLYTQKVRRDRKQYGYRGGETNPRVRMEPGYSFNHGGITGCQQ